MKKLFILLLLCLIALHLNAKDKLREKAGVRFFEGSWAELIKEAGAQGKLIFVDVYTDWCPPCKQMDKEVIPQPTVGSKYNEHFINYKIDAEKGEGLAIVKQYVVSAYPTYLYLDSKGNLLHRAIGFFEANAFIEHADQALSLGSEKNTITALESRFKKGERDIAFLKVYIKKKAELKLDNSEQFNVYLTVNANSKLNTPHELLFLGENIKNANSRAMVFLMTNFNTLAEADKKSIAPQLGGVFIDAIEVAVKEEQPLAVLQSFSYLELLHKLLPLNQIRQIDRYKLLYYGRLKNNIQLKKVGYKLVSGLMEIPLDSIKVEDERRYQQIMKPFLTGESDSTKIEGFAEEKEFIINVYSREISGNLYEVAKAFLILDAGDPALKDAVLWAERCVAIFPKNNNVFDALLAELSKK